MTTVVSPRSRALARTRSRASELTVTRPDAAMTGGGLEGASRTNRDTARWSPALGSADQIINRAKPLADARGRDMTQNDGYAKGAVSIHQDSIVGAQYRLTATPNLSVLNSGGRSAPKFDEVWAAEFAEVVEERFNLLAESEDCWLDAAGINTLTGLTRMAVGGYVWTGEVLGLPLWLRQLGRPCATAIQMIAPARLSNPYMQSDTQYLRGGIEKDQYGRPLNYWFRQGYPNEPYPTTNSFTWTSVPAAKPWGRRQVIHLLEQREPDQSRGIADMVSALKQMRMTKNFSEITLQNAVVQASYAAAIESDLPPEVVNAMMGGPGATGGPAGYMAAIGAYMTGLENYVENSNGIAIDGVKIPHLFPGTKLIARQLGTPGGVGQAFEQSLMRHIAAALGIGYEEFSRDFSRVSYSSARASMVVTGRFMRARKKMVADRFATQIFQLVFEEELANGNVPLPAGVGRAWFYRPLMKEAFTSCDWVGSGTGQIDELKETQAAILRVNSGFSTWQAEIARFGGDWRKVFKQQDRERELQDSLGLVFGQDAQKPTKGDASTQGTMTDQSGDGNNNADGANASAFDLEDLAARVAALEEVQ